MVVKALAGAWHYRLQKSNNFFSLYQTILADGDEVSLLFSEQFLFCLPSTKVYSTIDFSDINQVTVRR